MTLAGILVRRHFENGYTQNMTTETADPTLSIAAIELG